MTLPGTVPSNGTIQIGGVLSYESGANAGFHIHPSGSRAISTWCGPDSRIELWGLDAFQRYDLKQLDVELGDVGAQAEPDLVPPTADGGQEAWPTHVLPLLDSSLSANGSLVAVAAGRGIRLFDLASSGNQLLPRGVIRGHRGGVTRVGLSRGGDKVISTESLGEIVVWNVADGQPIHRFRISRVPRTAAFIWNDMLVAVGDEQGRIICWELQRGRRYLQFQAHHSAVQQTAFSPERGVLATCGADNAARLWDLQRGTQLGEDLQHRGIVFSAEFAYSGRFVVTASYDRHLGIWDAQKGTLLDWYRDEEPIYQVRFRPADGMLFISGERSLKALRVDWRQLALMDARKKSALIELREQPPVARSSNLPDMRERVDYHHANNAQIQAPIGAVMPPAETGELPIPDRSRMPVGSATGATQAAPPSGHAPSVEARSFGARPPQQSGPQGGGAGRPPQQDPRYSGQMAQQAPPGSARGAGAWGQTGQQQRADAPYGGRPYGQPQAPTSPVASVPAEAANMTESGGFGAAPGRGGPGPGSAGYPAVGPGPGHNPAGHRQANHRQTVQAGRPGHGPGTGALPQVPGPGGGTGALPAVPSRGPAQQYASQESGGFSWGTRDDGAGGHAEPSSAPDAPWERPGSGASRRPSGPSGTVLGGMAAIDKRASGGTEYPSPFSARRTSATPAMQPGDGGGPHARGRTRRMTAVDGPEPAGHGADAESFDESSGPNEDSGARGGAGARRATRRTRAIQSESAASGETNRTTRSASAGGLTKNQAGLIAVVLMLLGAIVGHQAVRYYYTNVSEPSEIAERRRNLETAFENERRAAERDLASFETRQRGMLRTYRDSGQMLPSEVERISREVERRIAAETENAERRIAQARASRDQGISQLPDMQEEVLTQRALYGLGIGAVLGLIPGLIVVRSVPDMPPPSKPKAEKQKSPRSRRRRR